MKKNFSIKIFLAIIFIFSHFAFADTSVKVYKKIVWAEPKGFQLTLDIYAHPTAPKKLPVLIIYHGGGWLINNNSIMNDMANYMAIHGNMVVVNVNYRLLTDNNNSTTLNEIVEDAIGAVLWVKDNIAQYKGDAERIAVTGDSAGGQLAAMIALAGRNLKSDGFANPNLGFKPTYLPRGLTAEDVAKKDGAKVQAVVLSYAAFDLQKNAHKGFETDTNAFWKRQDAKPRGIFGAGITVDSNPEFYKAVSPNFLVPNASSYILPPHFILVGSDDKVTPPETSSYYLELLTKAGQKGEMKIYEGKTHAFLDSGCSDYTHGCFKDLAPVALDDVILFLKKIFKN